MIRYLKVVGAFVYMYIQFRMNSWTAQTNYCFNCPIINDSNGSSGNGKRNKTFIVLIASIQYIISLSLDFIFIFHRMDRIWIKCYIQHCSNDDYWSFEFQDIEDSSRRLVYFLPYAPRSLSVPPNKWNEWYDSI